MEKLSPQTSKTGQTLSDIRHQIDIVDAHLLELLCKRGALVDKIADAKAINDTLPIRPAREAQQMQKLTTWHGQNKPPFTLESLHAIWREIISSAIAQQGAMTILCADSMLALARHCFGGGQNYRPIEDSPTRLETLTHDKHALALLRADDPSLYRFMPCDDIAVFACLTPPQAFDTSPLAPPLFVMGRVPQESTAQNNASLIIIAKNDIKGTLHSTYQNDRLVGICGFHTCDDIEKRFAGAARWLGTYTTTPDIPK